jgi:hypothetical protein
MTGQLRAIIRHSCRRMRASLRGIAPELCAMKFSPCFEMTEKNQWLQRNTRPSQRIKVRLPERIEHVRAFTRPSQHCEISQKSIRDWCSEIFWGISLNLVTAFPYRSLQVLKTFVGKHSVPFRKKETLTESQLRLMFRKICVHTD